MTAPADPFGYRERINEEAQRQLEMLRVTLQERIRVRENESPYGYQLQGELDAYRDVLSLLGPEPAWWTDPDSSEPF